MTGLEDLVQAAMSAPPERREAALRVLLGELPKSEPSVTLRELARRTGFGVTSLRRWRVPSLQMGGAKRYRVSEVEAYLQSDGFRRRQAALRAERKRTTTSKSTPGGAP